MRTSGRSCSRMSTESSRSRGIKWSAETHAGATVAGPDCPNVLGITLFLRADIGMQKQGQTRKMPFEDESQ
jgi:hypothetical protein